MKKFLVLYRASQSGFQQMMAASPEQQKAGMEAWNNWALRSRESIVDMGAPLGKAVRVSKNGEVQASPNDLGGYSIMRAESKEALAAQMRDHPHFMTPDGWIEIVDVIDLPGM